MKFIPPTDARWQCPTCGVPVEEIETSWSYAVDNSVILRPCGHETTVEALRGRP